MNLLAIETSTEFLSLAASRGDAVFGNHFEAGQRHAEMILGSISALLAQAGLRLGDLDGIAYGEGPGSFTGLRIACGVVQGLALARGLKVMGVSTLLALAEEGAADKAFACIDARMGEVYHAAYRRDITRRDGDTWQVVHAPGLCRPQEVPVPEGGAWTGLGSGFAAHGEASARAARWCAGQGRTGRIPDCRCRAAAGTPALRTRRGWRAGGCDSDLSS